MPKPPLPADRCGEWWYDSSVVTCGSATSTMSPPCPPLAPSGPASGLNFSRLTDTQPLPPLPADRCSVTRSTNVTMRSPLRFVVPDEDVAGTEQRGRAEARPLHEKSACGGLLRRHHDVDDLAAALRTELDRAGLEGEQRVVTATADVGAGVEVGAALTDDDLAGEDLLAAEPLHAEALCVGVTTVTGGACALFVCHVCVS